METYPALDDLELHSLYSRARRCRTFRRIVAILCFLAIRFARRRVRRLRVVACGRRFLCRLEFFLMWFLRWSCVRLWKGILNCSSLIHRRRVGLWARIRPRNVRLSLLLRCCVFVNWTWCRMGNSAVQGRLDCL